MAGEMMRSNGGERAGMDPDPALSPLSGKFFEIHVKGQLDSHWSDWLEGLEMKLLDHVEMLLSGYIVDQAALMGILEKLSRLNLAIRSVNEVKKEM